MPVMIMRWLAVMVISPISVGVLEIIVPLTKRTAPDGTLISHIARLRQHRLRVANADNWKVTIVWFPLAVSNVNDMSCPLLNDQIMSVLFDCWTNVIAAAVVIRIRDMESRIMVSLCLFMVFSPLMFRHYLLVVFSGIASILWFHRRILLLLILL